VLIYAHTFSLKTITKERRRKTRTKASKKIIIIFKNRQKKINAKKKADI